MASIQRGALIVFEGLDRSGKSTQSKLLVESLKKLGRRAERIVFPDRTTPIGRIIGEYLADKDYQLNDKALHLLFTANRFENMGKIKSLVNGGTDVVVDRYSYSGIVFSSIKKGMDVDWCKAPETGLPAPDVVFFLRLSCDEMKRRPGFGDERYEDVSTQLKAHEAYRRLDAAHHFSSIDAAGDVEAVQRVLVEKSLEVIARVRDTRLGSLNFIDELNGKTDGDSDGGEQLV